MKRSGRSAADQKHHSSSTLSSLSQSRSHGSLSKLPHQYTNTPTPTQNKERGNKRKPNQTLKAFAPSPPQNLIPLLPPPPPQNPPHLLLSHLPLRRRSRRPLSGRRLSLLLLLGQLSIEVLRGRCAGGTEGSWGGRWECLLEWFCFSGGGRRRRGGKEGGRSKAVSLGTRSPLLRKRAYSTSEARLFWGGVRPRLVFFEKKRFKRFS